MPYQNSREHQEAYSAASARSYCCSTYTNGYKILAKLPYCVLGKRRVRRIFTIWARSSCGRHTHARTRTECPWGPRAWLLSRSSIANKTLQRPLISLAGTGCCISKQHDLVSCPEGRHLMPASAVKMWREGAEGLTGRGSSCWGSCSRGQPAP